MAANGHNGNAFHQLIFEHWVSRQQGTENEDTIPVLCIRG